MYSLKYTGKNGDKRWVCLENKCNDSVTTKDEQIIKINGKSTTINKVLKHQHEAVPVVKIQQTLIYENLKKQTVQESTPVPQLFEKETIRLLKQGISTEEVAQIMPQYEEKKHSIYRRRWKSFKVSAKQNNSRYEIFFKLNCLNSFNNQFM